MSPRAKRPRQPLCEVADPKQLRSVFGAFATGIAVVTVGGESVHGMTANAFTTVSLDPPLILICVDRTAVMHDLLAASKRFAVSILASGQEPIARHFANKDRPLGPTQFEGVDWFPGQQTGAALITGALAHFELGLWRSYDGGDHTIFLGSLLSADRRADEGALLFLHGRYRQVDRERSEVAA